MFQDDIDITLSNLCLSSETTNWGNFVDDNLNNLNEELTNAKGSADSLSDKITSIENLDNNLKFISKQNVINENNYRIYTIKSFDQWTGNSTVFSFDPIYQSVDIDIDNNNTNKVLSDVDIAKTNEKTTFSFDCLIHEFKSVGNEIRIVLNYTTALKTITLTDYPLNRKNKFYVDIPVLENKSTLSILIPNSMDVNITLSNACLTSAISQYDWDGKNVPQKLIIPSKIPCGINYETNIFYDNILYNSYLKNVQGIIPGSTFGNSGNSQEKRLRIYQNSANSSTQFLALRVTNNNQNNKVYNYQLIPLNTNLANNKSKKILIIGDSLTQAGVYQQECNRLLNDNNFTAEFLGTKGVSPLYNEGRGGWSLKEYCENQSYDSVSNPFYHNGFDFNYYMSNQNYDSVDYVFINMGTNDMRNNNEDTLSYYDNIINSIKSYNSNISIFIGIAPPLCSLSRNEMGFYPRNKKLELAESLLSLYQNRENEKIFIVPFYLNFDAESQFNKTTITSNRYENGSTEIISDGTHPTNSGYYRMADTMFYSILYALSLE